MASGNINSSTAAASQSLDNAGAQPELTSFATALVLLPPPAIQSRVNGLRVANDKSYPRWTSHVTLIYPFVTRDQLPLQLESLRNAIRGGGLKPFQLCLDSVGRFRQRDYETVYLGQTQTETERSSGNEEVHALWRTLAQALGHQGRDFIPHMTLGQSYPKVADVQTLQSKGESLLMGGALKWNVNSVVVLEKDELDGGRMKIYDELFLDGTDSTDRSSIVHEEWPSFEYCSGGMGWSSNLNPPSLASFPDELNIMTFNLLHDPVHHATSRFREIRTALLARDSDILCLQEVTDALLSLLLADERIRSRWTWCTRGPTSPMESERNIVILAKQHLPFTWRRISLGGKHKAAAVLTLKAKSQPNTGEAPLAVVLAVVHLTAGLDSVRLDTKTKEFSALVHYLHECHPNDEWIITGDTNFPSDYMLSSAVQEVLEDVWESHTSKHSDIYDATYDPERNSLAAQTARENRSPQRYDRMYVKRAGRFQVRSVDVLDSAIEPASDHWPLHATLHLSIHPAEGAEISPITRGTEHLSCSPRTLSRPLSSQGSEDYQKGLAANAELLTFAQASRAIPNAIELCQRKEALQTLSKIIGASLDGEAQDGQAQKEVSTGPGPGPPATSVHLVLVPVGSFALSVDFPDSDLDCIVIGNITPSTFWALVKQRLSSKAAPPPNGQGGVGLKRFVKDAAVQMMVLEVEGIKIDMQYCPAAELAENWPSYSTSLEKEVLLSVGAMRVLNAHRDRLRLQTLIPYPHAFQLAYRSIKIFCIRRGIFSARFGYLGGIHLSILLCRLTEDLHGTASAMALVKEFFRVYSNFDWANDIVSVKPTETTYRRSTREPLVILSPERPVRNVAANASVSTRQAISTELRIAYARLCEGSPWSRVCGDARHNLDAFLGNFDQFVKLDLGYWGDSCMFARALIGFVESRLVRLLVDLHGSDGATTLRLWPERLTDLGSGSATKGSSIHGFYLLGLHRTKDAQNTKPLVGILQAFEESIRGNGLYFDASNCFVFASECGRLTLGENITVDVPIWSDGGFDEPDDKDEELATGAEDERDQNANDTPIRPLRSSAKKAQIPKVTSYLPADKLRTSSDVYNRLMWDPQLDQNDYAIGYEDRFDGVKEVPLKSWKRNVEDEAFIPFHRVVHFRQKSSGELVWDRRSKLDHVFRSGSSHQGTFE